MGTRTYRNEHLYLKIARGLEKQISQGTWKAGDKLPSVRMICREYGVSMSTAQAAFYELEARSLIVSRPQSGYYVGLPVGKRLDLPESSRPASRPVRDRQAEIYDSTREMIGDPRYTLFSLGVPADSLLPIAKLNKGLVQATRNLPGSGVHYEPVAGNEHLRRQIARWSFLWRGNLSADDILTTAGCITAISYCLLALAKRGDTIAVESPCFYGILQLAGSLGLNVVELPAHPQTGVDLDALRKVIKRQKISACLFSSNFNNPQGSLMPSANKKAAVALLEEFGVPLIEDDIYGDIYFGEKRPDCCKSYDEAGLVFHCGSFSKTLAPGYRVGWVAAPPAYRDELAKVKLCHSLSGTSLTHQVIAGFLETGRYEAHLRKLRRTLYNNYLQFVRVIAEAFPEGTKVSRPQGGLSLWVELPGKIETNELYELALLRKITFIPGPRFSLQPQFRNCLRLSYGLEWNAGTESALRTLGKLAAG